MKAVEQPGRFAAAVLAASALVPDFAEAGVPIPLGDPGFEDFIVPPGPGYAYATPSGYRPTSAWVDDLDSPPGYTQDDPTSSWLYASAYAERSSTNKKPSPRTGDQAMHGLFNYSAQETGAVFEADRTYTFALWAQNDQLVDHTNGVFLYFFDGNVPFSDANSLTSALFTAIPQRTAGMTALESQANWTQISVSYTVLPGAPEIGHPVGVGFFARRDSAVDDATLEVAIVPEPATGALAGVGAALLLSRRRRDTHGP